MRSVDVEQLPDPRPNPEELVIAADTLRRAMRYWLGAYTPEQLRELARRWRRA